MFSLRQLVTQALASVTTSALGLAVFAPAAAAPVRVYRGVQTQAARTNASAAFNVLHTFAGADGAGAEGSLALAVQSNRNGNYTTTLFGETAAGGASQGRHDFRLRDQIPKLCLALFVHQRKRWGQPARRPR